MITSVMRAGGLQIHNPQSADRAGVIVFDADPWDPVRDVALRAIRAADRQAQIVAAVGFPRPDLQAALFKSGADRIWFKLAPLHTLFGDSFKIAGTDC
jgi:hypothetical protein